MTLDLRIVGRNLERLLLEDPFDYGCRLKADRNKPVVSEVQAKRRLGLSLTCSRDLYVTKSIASVLGLNLRKHSTIVVIVKWLSVLEKMAEKGTYVIRYPLFPISSQISKWMTTKNV
jgi:hypothetical protein